METFFPDAKCYLNKTSPIHFSDINNFQSKPADYYLIVSFTASFLCECKFSSALAYCTAVLNFFIKRFLSKELKVKFFSVTSVVWGKEQIKPVKGQYSNESLQR